MSKEIETNTIFLNRLLKDKVFHDLFNNVTNLANFCNEYLDLTEPVTEKQITILKTADTFTGTLRSDLIFEARDEYIGIIEAMSSSLKKSDYVFFLAYFCKAFYDYVVSNNEKLRTAKKEDVVLPKFRIFILYSGNPKVRKKYVFPDVLAPYPIVLNLEIVVLTPNDKSAGNLTNQFLLFSKLESKLVKGKGSFLAVSEDEITNFINSMINRGILKNYLLDNRGELMNMFKELHNEEKYWEEQRQKDIAIGRKEGIEIGEKRGIKIGEKKGIAIGERKGDIKLIKTLKNLNIPINQMVQLTELPEDEIKDILSNLKIKN